MRQSTVNNLATGLASLRLTLVGSVLFAAGLVIHHRVPASAPWGIAVPLLLLSLNLAAALLVDARFRARPALFGFHLCLLALAGIGSWSQLASLHGRVIAVEGLPFDPARLEFVSRGPLAPRALALGDISQGRINVSYGPGVTRQATRSEIHLAGGDGANVGDDIPFRHDGVRLYTTSNKGFAAVVSWLPDGGPALQGTVEFGSYPASQIMQQTAWTTPGGQVLQLQIDPPLVDFSVDWSLNRTLVRDAPLTVTAGDSVRQLARGESLRVRGGRIRYERAAMWMGYRVSYLPGLGLLLSTALMAVLLMATHVYQRLAREKSRLVAGWEGRACR